MKKEKAAAKPSPALERKRREIIRLLRRTLSVPVYRESPLRQWICCFSDILNDSSHAPLQ